MPEYHHLCLVSDQLVPNYLPALEKELRASKVTLAVTRKMQTKGELLQKELKKHGISSEQFFLGEDAADFEQLQEKLVSWVQAHEEESIVLNATGGTKAMAIVAQEVFRMMGKSVFYVDIDSDNIWWLEAGECSPQWKVRCQLQHPIELNTYLQLNGYKVLKKTENYPNRQWLAMAEEFACNAMAWQDAITVLNGLAQSAEHAGSLYPSPAGTKKSFKMLDQAIEKLQQHGIIEGDPHTGRWHFASVEARAFVQGGWLEYYVFHHLKSIYPNNGMTFLNTEIEISEKVKNELDVLT
ncbi:MAG: DUF1887 family protein, partial [Kiritimatiellae bacterium]|nr:DUF1887 family protein [Kiritimatiellia bacterium]